MAATVPFPKRLHAARVRPPAESTIGNMTPPQSWGWTSNQAGQTPTSGLQAMSSSPRSSSAIRSPTPPLPSHCSGTATPPFGVPALSLGADQVQQCWPRVATWTDEDVRLKAGTHAHQALSPSTPRSHWHQQNPKSTDSRQQEQQQQSISHIADAAEGLYHFSSGGRQPYLWETPPAHMLPCVPSRIRDEEWQDKRRHFRVGRRVDLCCDLHAQEWQSARVVAVDHSHVRIQWASHEETFTIDDQRVRPKRVRFSLDLPVSPLGLQRQCIQLASYAHELGHRRLPCKDCC